MKKKKLAHKERISSKMIFAGQKFFENYCKERRNGMETISLRQSIQCSVAEQTKVYLNEKTINTPSIKIEIEGIDLSKQKEFIRQTLCELSERIVMSI